MKKLILKTALFTLLGVIGTIAVLYGIFALFFPKNIASVADQMGNYGVSVFYYEKAYEKSNSVNDLYELVLKLDENADSQKTSKYSLELLTRHDFSEIEKAGSPSTKEYVSAKYAMSTFLTGEKQIASSFCENYVLSYGYTEFNPFTVCVSTVINKLPKEVAVFVEEKLENIKPSLSVASEVSLINSDISALNSYINK